MGQCICHYVDGPPLELNIEFISLHEQSPAHQVLIVVTHLGKEHKRALVSMKNHRRWATADRHLEMLEGQRHGYCLLLYGGVVQLV